jgi:hypothetical protein
MDMHAFAPPPKQARQRVPVGIARPRRPAGGLLTLSAPGDASEREAERVADAVVGGGRVHVGRTSGDVQPQIRRAALRPWDLVDSILPPEDEEELTDAGTSGEIQRSAAGGAGAVTPQFQHTLHRAVGSGGEPMAPDTRSFMENRVGWNFSTVRVHRDAQADALAQEINARAFTIGKDIFFARSEYRPESQAGQHLLAHELTHVVQQTGGQVARQIQRQTRCSSYPGYNSAAALSTYNCAGLALRTYQYRSPASVVYSDIMANFINPQTPAGNSCGPGRVKFWMWEYDMHAENDQGTVLSGAHRDFHIVAGRADLSGADPTDVYSKNGARPVYGPGTGPGFRPAARERSTSNDASETPATHNGRPVFKVRTNMSEHVSCADCHP